MPSPIGARPVSRVHCETPEGTFACVISGVFGITQALLCLRAEWLIGEVNVTLCHARSGWPDCVHDGVL